MMGPRDGEITNIDMEGGKLFYYNGTKSKGTIESIPIQPEWAAVPQIKVGEILPEILRKKNSN